MMSCFEGLLEYGRLTGEQKHLDTVVRFAHRVIESDVTVIGSCGCTHELFDHSTYRQTCTDYEGVMQETCVTVTWMKFCMQLLTLTGDSVFADQIEQSLYNAYLGALNTEHKIPGGLPLGKYPDLHLEALPFDSYSPLVPGTRGRQIGGLQVMKDDMTYYGCCACIASAGIGLLSRVALQRGDHGLYLNLYSAGTIETRSHALVDLRRYGISRRWYDQADREHHVERGVQAVSAHSRLERAERDYGRRWLHRTAEREGLHAHRYSRRSGCTSGHFGTGYAR